jgi:putative ABC transport system ATP-binding protein/lipoprotein-releasing system ATP-binding protein
MRLEGVGHRFEGADRLFGGLSMTLEPGRVYALTGPSGSGKSTLLSILAGWMSPTEGSVSRDAVARVSWVLQNPHGVAGRTALDHVALPLLARGLARAEAEPVARELLARFMLAHLEDRQFRTLSGGEAQRLMLARGIASDPGLLLVDEPTAQLDRRTAESVNDSLVALRSEGTIVVIATHDRSTSDRCTDRVDLEEFR